MAERPAERKRRQDRVVDCASGDFAVRLAESAAEIDESLALRYRVFYEEMSAKPTAEMAARRQDFDRFDSICDHLLVFDQGRARGRPAVVGTYRLLRRSVVARHGRFYSADEFDIAPLLSYPGEILELGRSCVDSAYRTRPIMQLLWRGITEYVIHHKITIMFGCASLPGTNPQALVVPLSYLYYFHLAPPALRPRALENRRVDMRLCDIERIDPRKGLAALPPLIKGYLRLGGFVGDGAVVDEQFNTTDVCIIVMTDLVTEKYIRHYTRPDASGRYPRLV